MIQPSNDARITFHTKGNYLRMQHSKRLLSPLPRLKEPKTIYIRRNISHQRFSSIQLRRTREFKLRSQVESFQEVFPEKLPDAMPPHRSVEFKMVMKPSAQPSSRPPFLLYW